MIRFSCPGCEATYSVDDAKGGKTGKCPKCQSQFVIPMPEGGAAPPPLPKSPSPSPSIDPNAPVEIKPCPKCDARLSVASSDLGVDVECPYCKTVYAAVRSGSGAAAAPKSRPSRTADDEDERPSRKPRRRDEDEEEDDTRPSRRRRDEVEDDDRPSRRRRDDDEDEEARPSRRRRDDDEDEDRPRKKKRRRRSGGGGEPHRGGMILTLGILGIFCCGFCAIAAAIMGVQDLGKMNSGEMDPDGKPLTMIGMILGFIGILSSIALVIFNVAASR